MSMTYQLKNSQIELELDLTHFKASVRHQSAGIELVSPLPTIFSVQNGKQVFIPQAVAENVMDLQAASAPSDGITGVQWEFQSRGFFIVMEWGLAKDEPYIFWRWSIANHQSHPAVLSRSTMLISNNSGSESMAGSFPYNVRSSDSGLKDQGLLTFPGKPSTLAAYIPGWQSWSNAGWFMADQSFPRSKLGPFTVPMIYDRARMPPRGAGRFRSEMFMALMDLETQAALACGFLSQRDSCGSVELQIQDEERSLLIDSDLDLIQLEPGMTFSCDWACLILNQNGMGVVENFMDVAGHFNQARVQEAAPVGWCTWYEYGQNITETIILENTKQALALREQAPMDIIQIDDGFQSNVGDWLSHRPEFPSGLPALAGNLRKHGFVPGLWLAPFIALPGSEIVTEHPEWVLRDRRGTPVRTGLVWNQFGRALDLTHPGYLEHLQQIVASATAEWGFEYLKLDFLYAGILPGARYDPNQNRAQAFTTALQLIRAAAGEQVTLVGCGCPLGPGIGIFDSMRIGPDVATTWKPSYKRLTLVIDQEPTLPAAVNSIRNTVHRSAFHRRWWINDPDCLLVRDLNSELGADEILSLATAIGMSGGSLLLSDELKGLSREGLDIFSMLIPPLSGNMRLLSPLDAQLHPIVLREQNNSGGRWWLLAFFNTGDQAHSFNVLLEPEIPHLGEMHRFDVWGRKYSRHVTQEGFKARVPAHSAALYSLRPLTDSPAWIGDSLHFSQGLLVEDWVPGQDEIRVRLKAQRRCEPRIWFYIPGELVSVRYEGEQVRCRSEANGITSFSLHINGPGDLIIHWTGTTNDD